MSIVLDLIVVLIIIGTVVTVIKNGFIKTLVGFCSVIFAVIFGKLFSPVVSTWLYDFLHRTTGGGVKEVVGEMVVNGQLPTALELENVSGTLNKYNSGLAGEVNSRVTNDVVQAISDNVIGLLAYAVAFLIIFIVTLIVFKILGVILNGIFKLPVLKTINKALSFVLAGVMAVLYVMIFASFMQLILPVLSSMYPDFINLSTVESTLLFEFFYNFDWIKLFVN